MPGPGLAAQVPVGCRHHPNRYLDPVLRTHRLDLSRLEESQEFDLEGWRKLAHFIEEKGAATGHFDGARVIRIGTGEGPPAVSEKFALEQVLRNCTAIDGNKWSIRVGPKTVESGRDEFFAGPRLAANQHRQVQRRHPRHRLVDLDDGGIAADDQGLGSFGGRRRTIGEGGECGLDPPYEVLELEGFGQIVEDAVASGEGRRLDAAAGGDQNDAGFALPFLDGIDEIETGPIAEIDVGNDEVKDGLSDGGNAVGGRSRAFDPIAFLGESQRHHLPHGVVVIDHEDSLFHRFILPRADGP